MAREVDEVLRDALALPLEARAALTGSLLESLDPSIDEGAKEAWRPEIHRRIQEIDIGAVHLIPREEARPRVSTAD